MWAPAPTNTASCGAATGTRKTSLPMSPHLRSWVSCKGAYHVAGKDWKQLQLPVCVNRGESAQAPARCRDCCERSRTAMIHVCRVLTLDRTHHSTSAQSEAAVESGRKRGGHRLSRLRLCLHFLAVHAAGQSLRMQPSVASPVSYVCKKLLIRCRCGEGAGHLHSGGGLSWGDPDDGGHAMWRGDV